MTTKPEQRLWVRSIQKGDVLRAPSGRLRIVRSVSHRQTSPHTVRTSVCFTIGHTSWTGRPYTVLTGTDLTCTGYRPTKARAKLNSAFDWAMEREMESGKPPIILARDVVGIP